MKGVKKNFPTVDSKGLEKDNMAKAVFHLNKNVVPVLNRNVVCHFQLRNPLTMNLKD